MKSLYFSVLDVPIPVSPNRKNGKKSKREYQPFRITELNFIRRNTVDALPGKRLSATELAKFPELRRHTKESIATRIKKMGYADQDRSIQIKSGRWLSGGEKQSIAELLKNEYRFWPTSVLAPHLKLSENQVRRFRNAQGLTLKHSNEAMLDPVYRNWYESKEKKRITNLRAAFKKRKGSPSVY